MRNRAGIRDRPPSLASLLIPQIEPLTNGRPKDDGPATAALAGVGDAQRRLREPQAAGLHGEVERVKRLARSVVARSDHCDTLNGLRACLACDKRIDNVAQAVPADSFSASGGVVRSGHVHAVCAGTVRRR